MLYLPTDRSLINDPTVDFEWTVGLEADNHRIEIDNDADFSSPVEKVWYGPNDNTHTSGYLSDDNYSWRVVTVDSAGNENFSPIWTFIIKTVVGKPSPYLPADGTFINQSTVDFEWTIGSGADSHRIEIDNDPDFSSPEENVGYGPMDNTHTSGLLADGNYSWRIWAIDNLGNKNVSSVWMFVVDTTPPTAATLHAPENGTTTSDNAPTFEWTVGAGAAEQRLLISVDPNFSQLKVDTLLDIWENTYTPSPLADENYWWKVIAIDRAGNESESPVWTFTVQT